MEREFVAFEGIKYYVEDGALDLSGLYITDISAIEGLEGFVNPKELYLDKNQIYEIKGLEHLTNLEELDLQQNKIQELKGLESLTSLQILELSWNRIEELKGLESLTNLQILCLSGDPIKEDEQHLLEKNAQEVVSYYQEKARKEKR